MCIESINEKHAEELAAAKAKIASLRREFRTSEEKVESLECELTEAIELINVSTPLWIHILLVVLTPLILLPCPEKLTPHIIKKKGKYMQWDLTVT